MKEKSQIDKIYEFLDNIKETDENRELIQEAKNNIDNNKLIEALEALKQIKMMGYEYKEDYSNPEEEKEKKKTRKSKKVKSIEDENNNNEEQDILDNTGYPKKLANDKFEEAYIGILYNQIKGISTYYFKFDECFFVNEELLNLYKTLLFTDADKYAPEVAKDKFRFPNRTVESDMLKRQLKNEYSDKTEDIEKVYMELKKLFILRKSYIQTPIKSMQQEIADIIDYELYDDMSIEEIESAIEQVTVTEKFKRAVLNEGITDFLVQGNNTLTNGLRLPFKILSSVFKGVRRGETMAFAMPSNAGKSRFTINMSTYIALMHKKKVLIISNEMSEEKMRLCLITTIINNPEIQALHGQTLRKTEGELLEFKYRPDDPTKVKVDQDGFVIQEEKETHSDFVKRLLKVSKEFKMTTAVTNWFNNQVGNYMYFINITDHTNDELKKVIMNYYYKEKVQYVFYDTLKTDIENIGNTYEIKKTATILSNLAQNFGMFIASTLQLAETDTDPINLNINDLAVSRTVKEVLDTLCLIKQIHNEDLEKYEYSLNEVDTKFFDLEKFENPDVRYYACVVDKNRAGSKPKLVFRLNLAYNEWNELGYIRLKSK